MSYIGTEPKDIRSFGRTQFDYTATQGQTAFTGADDDGKVLAFTTGQIEVFVNGILMDESDFTTTGTGTVTLASAANLNDVISIVSFESNIPDNDYVPASGGTFTGNVTHSGTVINNGNVGISTTPTAKLHLSIGTSTDDFDQVLIEGSSSSSSSNPEITLKRNNPSPGDNYFLGSINFYGKNDADEDIKYAQVVGRQLDISDSSEDGALVVYTEAASTQRETLFISGSDTRLRTNNLRISSHLTSGENSAGPTIALVRNDTSVVSGDVLGTMGFGHFDGTPDFPTQTPQQLPASIRAVAAETQGSGDNGANMEFYTKPINANKDVSSTLNMKINNDGSITKPNQPHILGTPKNSAGNGIADAFYTHVSYPPIGLSFSNSRITVPVAGVYLITYNAIADNGTGREDINILINGNAMCQSLTATNESGYRQNNVTNAIKLEANDYIQFDHDDWYNPSTTGYDPWMTASVTLLG